MKFFFLVFYSAIGFVTVVGGSGKRKLYHVGENYSRISAGHPVRYQLNIICDCPSHNLINPNMRVMAFDIAPFNEINFVSEANITKISGGRAQVKGEINYCDDPFCIDPTVEIYLFIVTPCVGSTANYTYGGSKDYGIAGGVLLHEHCNDTF